jgi:hypothetical protein
MRALTAILAPLFLIAAAMPIQGDDAQPAAIELLAERSQVISIPNATAVYPLDDGIVEVVLRNGVATVAALAPGSTQLVIVTPAGLRYLPVIVHPQKPSTIFRRPASLQDSNGSFEVQYDSLSNRLQNILGYRVQDGERLTSIFLNDTVLRGPGVPHVRHVIPAASFRIFTRERELVLLDDSVRSSPLTLFGPIVRGIHVRDGGLQFHAGYSSFSIFDSLLFSRTRAAVAGVSYTENLGDRSSITPRLYVFPTRNSGRGTAGTVASLDYHYDHGPALQLRAEGAVSRSLDGNRVLPGANFEFSRSLQADSRSLRIEYQPDGFASLDTAVHGFRSDALWIRDLSPRWRSSFTSSANRISLAGFRQTNAIGEELLRFAVTPHWFLQSGGRYTYLDTPGSLAGAIATREVPVGLEYGTPRAGADVVYTFIWSDGIDRGGNGINASIHGQTDHFTGNLYALRRTQTPTLDFVFNEIPGLDLLLHQFGLSASTPQDLLRLLHDFPDLANAGVIRGINVNISPVHYQAGSLLSWRGRSEHEPRLEMSMHYSRDELVAHTRQSGIATVTYAQKLSANLELATQFSRFLSRQDRGKWSQLSGWNVSLRHRFSDLPTPASVFARHGVISGVVFADPDGSGEFTRSARGLGDVEVWLDQKTKTTTTRDGHFAFSGVRAGPHQVEVRYPSAKAFRYTTPPTVDTNIDRPVVFGIGTIAAHLTAIVRTTDGSPVNHVQIAVHDGARLMMHETADGKSAIDFPRAEVVQVAVNADSLPPGYAVVDGGPKSVELEEARPATVSFVLKPLRSVSGRVTSVSGDGKPVGVRGARISLDGNAASNVTDEEGEYVFRNLARGKHVLQATYAGRILTREAEVPDEPASLHDVNFDFRSNRPASPASATLGGLAVQIGAYRLPSNAERAMRDAQAAGLTPYVLHVNGLAIVRAGPFSQRSEAEAAIQRLAAHGLSGIVVTEHSDRR